MLNRRRFLALSTLASSASLHFLSACTSDTKHSDVVIIGAGHSGLAAAVSAAQQGAKVTVIEKRPFVGLNTHSDRGLFASSLSPKGIPSYGDSPENHFHQSYTAGSSLADVELLRAYVQKAPETLAWLDSLGMRFAENPINSNSLWRRCYQPLHSGYTETLYREALIRGVTFVFDHAVEDLSVRENKACTVFTKNANGERETWKARKGVVLCSGGFGANKQLIAQYAPRYKDLNSDNELGSTGEVLLLAQKIGARLTGMDRISCLPRPPGSLHSQGYLHLDLSRFLYINGNGKRFVSEDALRPQITQAFFEQGNRNIFEIADDATVNGYQMDIQRDLWRGIENGTVFRGKTLEDLAEKIAVPASSLVETVSRYNRYVEQKEDFEFSKNKVNLSHKLENAPFWAVRVEMMVHETLGGLVVDPHCRVFSEDGLPIKGLYAAGSIIGNLHGDNRLGGNGISSAITLGKLAGQQAAAEAWA